MTRNPVDEPGQADPDGGVATILSAVLCLGLIAVLWLGMQVGTAVVARNRAEGAADLAALAVAAYAAQGTGVACARAEWVVRGMHMVLTSCRLDGWEGRVEVRADGAGILADLVAVGHARAGPTESAG